MKNKLGYIAFSGYLFCLPAILPGQTSTELPDSVSSYKKPGETEVTFLYSYYEQDGDHSPVLGGTGTEYLTDHVGKITVNIPLKNSSISLSAGIDHYTSASTDNINPASVSSASVVDDRIYFLGTFSKEKKEWSFGFNGGYSTEWDVTSYSGGFFLAKTFNEDNSQLNFNFLHYSDQWELIFPVEIRNELPLDSTDWRYVFDWSLTFSQVLSKKMQASVSGGLTLQSGYLATPFHRVYFRDGFFPKPESLPRKRLKLPIGLRLNYFASDFIITKTHYRFYIDDFGIKAHTAGLELPVKPKPFLAFMPFYRFHTQTAAKYFAPIDTHLSTERYFTSDYDLSAFKSHKIGLGIRYSPVNGILRNKKGNSNNQSFFWKKLEGRYAWYQRSDGLSAYIVSLASTFSINH